MKYKYRYLLAGALFGCCFPIGALSLEIIQMSLPFAWSSVSFLHQANPLHYIIDTAPFFLGVFASFAGHKQDQVQELNKKLEEKIKKRTKALGKAKKRAEAAAEAKSHFISNMSHEIRTPMNAVLGLTDVLLKDQSVQGQARKNIELIKYSADNLMVIVNDVLDFSKVDSGKMTLEKVGFCPRQLLNNLVHTVSFKVSEKGIAIYLDIDESIPRALMGDPYRLNQILLNLVTNAIKFTSEGEIRIGVSVRAQQEGKVELFFSIKDTGIGIPQKKLKSIFQIFTQAKTDTTRNYGGTGLGLAICKKLIDLQNGTISVDSEEGKGSDFQFVLEFDIAEECEIEAIDEKAKSQKSLEGNSILVVEDNAINRLVAKQVLNKWKIKPQFAENGCEAVEYFKDSHFDIILMDLQMPVMNGYEATQKIRKLENGHKTPVPIIALSADAFEETKTKVLQSGFDDYITKPFDPDDLYATLLKYAHG